MSQTTVRTFDGSTDLSSRHADSHCPVIATSGPSSSYPQRAYRNPTEDLVKFLDLKHGSNWSIWEFRAEGTGYPDEEVYNRIRHYPWPDHHPPPFALIPDIMASMREWLKGPEAKDGRVVVVHCQAGKGRSGTVACSYLISEEGWSREEALARFTARRMRSGFGEGISIPSQQRWVKYVEWWTTHGKVYVERPIEILEVHVWGLRDGVKVAVEGYVDAGRIIKTFHTFNESERIRMMDEAPLQHLTSISNKTVSGEKESLHQNGTLARRPDSTTHRTSTATDPRGSASLFRPSTPITLPTSDINIDFERRNKALYGLSMVTSVAHVWFNAFFESQFSSTTNTTTPLSASLSNPHPTSTTSDPFQLPTSGVFSIPWEAMDGIRGSTKKGTRAFDRVSVVWRAAAAAATTPASEARSAVGTDLSSDDDCHHIETPSRSSASATTKVITQPEPGMPVPESGPAKSPRHEADVDANDTSIKDEAVERLPGQVLQES